MYKISFLWYSALGAVIMYTVSIAVSHLTNTDDHLRTLDINLLASCVRFLVPKKYRHTELSIFQSQTTAVEDENSKMHTNTNENEWIWKESRVKTEA